jgi:hypothetical protein
MNDYGSMVRQLMMAATPVADKFNPLDEKMNPLATTEGARGYSGSSGRARAGGETAKSNNYFYKGGQFLPSTATPPGTFRVGRKLVKAKKAEIAPGEYATQPSPGAKATYQSAGVGYYTKLNPDGTISMSEGVGGRGVRDYNGNAVTLDSKVQGDLTLGDLIKLYNSGTRWIE